MIAQRLMIFLVMGAISSISFIDPKFKRLACLEVFPNDPEWKQFATNFKEVMRLAYDSMYNQFSREASVQQAVTPDLTDARILNAKSPKTHNLFFFKGNAAKDEIVISNAKKLEVFEANLISELFPDKPEGWVPSDFYIVIPQGAEIISYEISLISGYYYEIICYKYNNMYFYAQINTGIRVNIKSDHPVSRRLAEKAHEIGKGIQSFEDVFSQINVVKGFITDNINLINSCYRRSFHVGDSARLPLNFFSKYVNKAFWKSLIGIL